MKTTDLLNALSIVKPGLSNKELIEQSSSFAFMGNRVVTYNDEISVSHPVEDLDIIGAVKAEELYKFLHKTKQEDIAISVEDNVLLLAAGRSKVTLTLEADIKLDLSELQKKKKWKKLPPSFLNDIKFVAKAASKNAAMPAMTCLNIRADGFIEATDRFRACRCTSDFDTSFLLPADVVVTITTINPTKICVEKNWVHFKTPTNTILSCRIFNAEFPAVDPFFKKWGEGDDVLLSLPKELLSIVEKAMIFSKRDYVMDEFLYITVSKKKIKVVAKSEYASFEETTEMEYKGEQVQFKIVPHLFLDILKEKDTIVYLGKTKIKFEAGNWKYLAILSQFE